ncbi:MAG TPA: flagellar basal body P-ring protein FlgI [Bryobacteraceae bacterium]|jgi:flagellar P-ring protein precursor FlgI|nr:flagellar basal body P-ring protein FlgI [Bryobacteraceae bacterium]
MAFCLVALASPAPCATRLKDLAGIEGVRDNPLIGYGLVVGLAGKGDTQQTVFSPQSLANMLERMGVSVPGATIRVKDTAAVMITATLPPFAQPGIHLDVTAAAIGDATNLQGGILLLTPLKAADGQVYAVAQGAVVTGGFVAGHSGASQTVNHPTVGRVPSGGIVERPAPSLPFKGVLHLQLRYADFTTASRIAAALNAKYGAAGALPARAENSALVSVRVPSSFAASPVDFIAEMETLTVDADQPARVVVNERTGTIVMGRDVHISPVAILHGNLTVEIQTSMDVSQPPPLSAGTTAVAAKVAVDAKEEPARNVVLKQGATVEELVHALAAIGSTPRDIIAILQNLRSAGALEAELEVI